MNDILIGVVQAENHGGNTASLHGSGDPVMLADQNDDPGRNAEDVNNPSDKPQFSFSGRGFPFGEDKEHLVEKVKTASPDL